jgi:hypothetical protein
MLMIRGGGGGRALSSFLGTHKGGRGLSLGGEITLTYWGRGESFSL